MRVSSILRARTLLAIGALVAPLLWPGGAALAQQVVFEDAATSHFNPPAMSLVVDKPPMAVQGDLLLAQILFLNGSDINITVVPGGWEPVRRDNWGSDIGSAIYFRFAGDSEPTTYTWGFSQAVSAVGGILAYSGVDPINPIVASSGNGGDSSLLFALSIDGVANAKLIAFFGIKRRTFLTTPAGMTERYFAENGAFGTVDAVAAKAADLDLAADGATGNRVSATFDLRSDKWVAQLVALRAAVPTVIEPLVLYLHNNPTPPTGHTNRQANLPMDTTEPTATTLFRYSANSIAAPGRMIQKDSGGHNQTDLTKYQNWRTEVLTEGLDLLGDAAVTFFSGMKDFATNSGQRTKRGVVRAYLRDCPLPTTAANGCTLIQEQMLNQASWHGGLNQWMENTISFPELDYVIASGRVLELKFTVGSNSDDDMMFAYDTVDHKSRLIVP